jgi:hypothetical protein
MARQTSTGRCALCGETFPKTVMTRHLTKCLATHPARAKTKSGRTFRLLVEGRYSPMFWLHLELSENATLRTLDSFLRAIWLECCGHLSAFEIENVRYELSTGGVDAMWQAFPMFARSLPQEASMDAKLKEALRPGLKFSHEYDFGSTTELALKVSGEQSGALSARDVRILARNFPPDIRCGLCEQPATDICVECLGQKEETLCAKHAAKHKHEDMLLPVVNSPRLGVCGYTGPSDPTQFFNP